MRNIFEEAAALQDFLTKQGFSFCFIGGLALQRWGDLRTTNDIDLTLLTGFGGEESFIKTLLAHYEARIPDALQTALDVRVLLLRSPTGVGIDIALGGLPFEEESIARSSEAEFLPGVSLRTCSAEDLIVYKAFAARPKDWIDLEGILLRQRTLDWSYIEKQLKPLLELKEEPEHYGALIAMRAKFQV